MKLIYSLFLYQALIVVSTFGYSQCQPDSIITYQIVNQNAAIASVESFQYDNADSLIKTWLINFDEEGKPKPSYQISINREKVKGGISIRYVTDLWNDARAAYHPSSLEIHVRNKKGKLLSKEVSDYLNDNEHAGFVKVSRSDYVYNKIGELIEEYTYSWDVATNTWVNSTKKTVSYTNHLAKETIFYTWQKEKQNWTDDWKHVNDYDSANVLTVSTSYQSFSDVWIPVSRTLNGVEISSPIKWNRVQKWDGEKMKWQNQFQNVFQFDDKDLITTEVHLSWAKDEWKIDFAVFYKYNDDGEMVKILNDSQQIIWERFCAQH